MPEFETAFSMDDPKSISKIKTPSAKVTEIRSGQTKLKACLFWRLKLYSTLLLITHDPFLVLKFHFSTMGKSSEE